MKISVRPKLKYDDAQQLGPCQVGIHYEAIPCLVQFPLWLQGGILYVNVKKALGLPKKPLYLGGSLPIIGSSHSRVKVRQQPSCWLCIRTLIAAPHPASIQS